MGRNLVIARASAWWLSSLLFMVLVLGPGLAFGQGALLRLLVPSDGKGVMTKQQQRIQLRQQELQQIEAKIEAMARSSASRKQLFDKELREYQVLVSTYRQPLKTLDVKLAQRRQTLLVLAQRCVSDLLRSQSVGQLQEQSRRDLREALRLEIEAYKQLKEYLQKHYSGKGPGGMRQLQARVVAFENSMREGRLELKRIISESNRLDARKKRFHKGLERLRRRLNDSSGSSEPPSRVEGREPPERRPGARVRPATGTPANPPTSRPTSQPSGKGADSPDVDDSWQTRILLLRINRYRIRIRLLQMLRDEERLNRKALDARLRLYEYSLALIRRHQRRLGRLSEGGLLYMAQLPLHFRWIADALTHTRALRDGRVPKLSAPLLRVSGRAKAQWGWLSWLYISLFVLIAGLLVYVLFRMSQRAIDRLTQRANEELLLLRLWQVLRLGLRLLRDLASWGLFLLPGLWLVYSLWGGTVWWDFAVLTTWCLLGMRLGWTLSQRLFGPDAAQRLLRDLNDKQARLFRRTTKSLLMVHLIALPGYALLSSLRYPEALLDWLVVLYLVIVVAGLVLLLLQKDAILSVMPRNTIFERILIVAMFRLYPLVWGIPVLLFGVYLWGYRNLAGYLAGGLAGTIGVVLLTDLLAVLLWAALLWLLGFTNEDESILVEPEVPPTPHMELDLPGIAVVQGEPPAGSAPEGGDALATAPDAEAPAVTESPAEPASAGIEAVAGEAEVVAAVVVEAPLSPAPTAPVVPEAAPALHEAVLPYLRLARIGYVIAVGLIWLGAVAILLEVWQVPGGVKAIPAALTYPIFQATELHISLWILLKVFGIFALSMWLGKVIPNLLDEYAYPTLRVAPASSFVTNALLRYFIMCVGVFFCFRMLQVGSRGFLVLLAVFGLSISYGLRKVVHNFISGLLLLFGRAVAVGDYVESKKHRGRVKKITARSTTIQTSTGKLILIPNGKLLDDAITNWLAEKPYFRDRMDFHVAVDSDLAKVQSILLEIAKAHADVQATPKPVVRLRDVSGRSLEVGLTVTLLNPMAPGRIRSDLRTSIMQRFRDEGIELALPQQELHLHPELEALLLERLDALEEGSEGFQTTLPPLSRWRMDRTTPPKSEG